MNKLIISLVLLVTTVTNADVVTFRFSSVWAARDTFLQTCLYSLSSCGLTPQEIPTVQAMLQNSAQEKDLNFVSGQQNSVPFGGTAGSHNVVGTRAQVGAGIYINIDTLYQNGYGASYNFAIEYLTAVWAFHNQMPWLASQVLGQKLATYWGGEGQLLSLSQFGIRDMELAVFASPYRGAALLIDEKQGTDFFALIEKQLPCNGANQVIGIQEIAGISWTQFTSHGNSISGILSGQISFSCGQAGRPLERWTAQTQVSMEFDKSSGLIELNPSSVRIHLLNLTPNTN